MDFMGINNSLSVRFELKELEEDCLPYRAGTLWAEADTDHAAELMRKVWQDPAYAGKIGARARRDMEENFNPEMIGAKMAARLSLSPQVSTSRKRACSKCSWDERERGCASHGRQVPTAKNVLPAPDRFSGIS